MGKLAELVKTEAATIKAEKENRRQALAEWLDLLAGLFRRIDGWVSACDPNGLLDVTEEKIAINDPALGEYEAPARRIELGDRSARIVPVARHVAMTIRLPGADKPVRAHGLVEIRDFGGMAIYLFQLPRDDWYIQSEAGARRVADNAVELLDADNFEGALARFLR